MFFYPLLGAVQKPNYGVLVKSSQNKTFKNLKLKVGDSIEFFNDQPLSSYKNFLHKLLKAKNKKISLIVKRKSKYYRLSYKKKKNKYTLLKIKRLKSKDLAKIVVKSQPSSSKSQSFSKQKNTLTKYKKHLQNAYVIAEKSFIYKKPNFDSKQIHVISPGAKVRISKKIFYPSHKFGSFFKIFIKTPRKIVGYISEAEVVPEYLTSNKKKLNPKYSILEKQIKKQGGFETDLKKLSPHREEEVGSLNQKIPFLAAAQFKGLGILWGWRAWSQGESFEQWRSVKNLFLGFKWTTKSVLFPHVDLDFNFYATPFVMSFPSYFYYAEILASYPVLKYPTFSLSFLGGVNVEFDKTTEQSLVSPKLVLGLSLLKPFSFTFWRGDIKTEFNLKNQQWQVGLFTSFQIPF